MKMIITMAGIGQRFKNIGINKPKYKINIKGRSLFEWSMSSLEAFKHNIFIFILQKNDADKSFMKEILKKIGINNYSIIIINESTDGQATTAFAADQLLHETDSVSIYNIDTYVKSGILNPKIILNDYDGFIPVINETGSKWSYVKIDDMGRVLEIAEKKEISDLATIGFYYFKYWKDFKKIYFEHKEEIKSKYKEIYVAPMYNYLIKNNRNISIKIILREKVIILGTPSDIEIFDKDYLKYNK